LKSYSSVFLTTHSSGPVIPAHDISIDSVSSSNYFAAKASLAPHLSNFSEATSPAASNNLGSSVPAISLAYSMILANSSLVLTGSIVAGLSP
jgi:hypothetical protein